jgi:hypothetical protein
MFILGHFQSERFHGLQKRLAFMFNCFRKDSEGIDGAPKMFILGRFHSEISPWPPKMSSIHFELFSKRF